jgi:phosphoadenosine phosphosulfate reductase
VRPETSYLTTHERVRILNARYAHHDVEPAMAATLADPIAGKTALVSSFGAQSVVLLHLVSQVARDLPVIFVDTELMFPETLEYQRKVSRHFGLSSIRVFKPSETGANNIDPIKDLHKSDPNSCCNLRKVTPFQQALSGYDSWITGRKRFQNNTRTGLNYFEAENETRVKINPLAYWSQEAISAYMDRYNLPRHPLIEKGFASIGCAPCTTKVGTSEDPRSGRWRGQEKVECGIHFKNGAAQRAPIGANT